MIESTCNFISRMGIVSKETVVLRRWEIDNCKFDRLAECMPQANKTFFFFFSGMVRVVAQWISEYFGF